MTTERIITLRARRTQPDLAVGMLLGSPKGRVVYRVVEITRLRRAGELHATRMRVFLARLRPADVPQSVQVLPWPADRQAPRKPSQTAAQPVPRPPAEMALLIAASRRTIRTHRPARVHHYGVDVGPTLRLDDVVDGKGTVLRAADVTVSTVRDPAQPQRLVRRAVRADPLLALQRAGSISGREVEAAEVLRSLLEAMTPPLGESGGVPVHTSPFLRKPISAMNIDACQEVREASYAVGWLHWEAVIWICLGGTVTGFSTHRRMRTETAGELVRVGMTRLADHFEGGSVLCAQ